METSGNYAVKGQRAIDGIEATVEGVKSVNDGYAMKDSEEFCECRFLVHSVTLAHAQSEDAFITSRLSPQFRFSTQLALSIQSVIPCSETASGTHARIETSVA